MTNLIEVQNSIEHRAHGLVRLKEKSINLALVAWIEWDWRKLFRYSYAREWTPEFDANSETSWKDACKVHFLVGDPLTLFGSDALKLRELMG